MLLVYVTNAQGTWEKLDVPVSKNLNSVCFVDSLFGWVAGDSGTILHTVNGGLSWDIQNSQTNNDIMDVFFLNRHLGWASSFNFISVPFGTVLLKTTDGGINWSTETYPEENIFITCMLFLDSLNGWMGGRPHALVKTFDGGMTWNQAVVDTSILAFFPVLDIQFYDDNYGYASGGIFDIAGVIWHTNNGGELWHAIEPVYAPADEVHGLHLFDSINVVGAGGDPDFGYGVGMLWTSNGGSSWEYVEPGFQGNAYDIDFRTEYEAWAPLGPRQKFIYTLDTGLTWIEIATPGSTSIFDVMFPDSLHGFAVGHEGAVLKYKPPFPVQVESISDDQIDSIILHQNYPNPFSMGTTIKFHIPESLAPTQHACIKIFDLNGNEIVFFEKQELQSGYHEIFFDASALPEGIYLYRLETTSISLTRKMIIIK